MKSRILLLALGTTLAFNACVKEDQSLPDVPLSEQRMLGVQFQPADVYNQFPKADLGAIAKSQGYTNIPLSLPVSYTITGAPVGDQGGEGSCVAWATAYATASALEYNVKGTGFPTATRSPEYVYNQIKIGGCGGGAYVTDGLNLIKNQGLCSWSEMPYTDAGCATMPDATQTSAASTHKFSSWATVAYTNLTQVKTLISMNLPIIIAVTVDQSFYNMSKTNWIWTNHKGRQYGGHAIAVIGYDDSKQAFKVQNSWGTSWGQQGYFWISYSFFIKTTNGAVNECYVAYM